MGISSENCINDFVESPTSYGYGMTRTQVATCSYSQISNYKYSVYLGSLPDYDKLTTANFSFEITGMQLAWIGSSSAVNVNGWYSASAMSYNPNTGYLTIPACIIKSYHDSNYCTVDVAGRVWLHRYAK